MDEGVGEEVTALDTSEGGLLRSKESEFSLKSESGSLLEPREMVIPSEKEHHESTSYGLADIVDPKNASRNINSVDSPEDESMDCHLADDVGGMVEELTVRNFDNLNMAIVGTSNSMDRIQTRPQRWPPLSTMGSSRGYQFAKEGGHDVSHLWEDITGPSLPGILSSKPSRERPSEVGEELPRSDLISARDKSVQGGIKTKVLSKWGFSEFFIKHTLKGKGIIHRGVDRDRICIDAQTGGSVSAGIGSKLSSGEAPTSAAVSGLRPVDTVADTKVLAMEEDGVNLGEWLRNWKSDINKMERLNIFRQIVEFVDSSHTKGIAIQVLRPSYFKLMPSNRVKYLGLCLQGECAGNIREKHIPNSGDRMAHKRAPKRGLRCNFSANGKKQKADDSADYGGPWPRLRSTSQWNAHSASGNNISSINQPYPAFVHGAVKSCYDRVSWKAGNSSAFNATDPSVNLGSNQLEEKWYNSPEGCNGGTTKLASDIYCLGVLLFELLGRFDSEKARTTAMMDLRHRILPPSFLSENPREAGFCLWLLHPEPSSRPTSREMLQSEVLNELHDVCPEELSSSIEQDDAESELLSHFLVTSKEQKQKSAFKLLEDLKCLEADIQEIAKRRHAIGYSVHPCPSIDLFDAREENFNKKELSNLHIVSQPSLASDVNKARWQGNLYQLESAYFSMRSRIQSTESDALRRLDCDVLRNCDNSYLAHNDEESNSCTDQVGAFFDGLCKYARYSKFKLRGVLRNGEFNNSANVICSLSFDRDQDYFAAAGVSRKIKIFEFDALLNQSVDIHYPVVEMPNKSKLSCVCWNNYIRSYLASSDYDGTVKLWDASTGQVISEHREHEKRAWSVDFSPVYPTKFASGSDDCSVKLWSINERNRLGTIRNIANICCVQFSAHSTHLLAFGSADYKTYCYDLRNARSPWCILAGHEKAVSYVKFLDSDTVVTASTDNTLKLWDLTKSSPDSLSTSACCLTLRGHTNEKNFVGLSVANGYITCGSETNEVFTYYRSLPMPITSYKFGSIDPISGKETEDDNGQFVSSVCWRRKSDMVVAANSTGCIKVLEMV